MAEEEGLTLQRSDKGSTGLRGVSSTANGNRFRAQVYRDGKLVYLGTFVTAEEGALYVARYVRGLVDDWLIPGRATSGGQSSKAKRKRGASSPPGTSGASSSSSSPSVDASDRAKKLLEGRELLQEQADRYIKHIENIDS